MSPVAVSYPRALAGPMPRMGSRTTMAPAASATSAVSSVLPLSTITISSGWRVCAASAAKHWRSIVASFSAGMTTVTRGMARPA